MVLSLNNNNNHNNENMQHFFVALKFCTFTQLAYWEQHEFFTVN